MEIYKKLNVALTDVQRSLSLINLLIKEKGGESFGKKHNDVVNLLACAADMLDESSSLIKTSIEHKH